MGTVNKVETTSRFTSARVHVGLAAGPLLFAAMLLIGPPEGMTLVAWRTAAVGLLMATWWITEAIPIPCPTCCSWRRDSIRRD